MKIVLAMAAVYNLAWGIFVIVQPRLFFAWAAMEPINYPSIVQCLGMVIGVYGIGYAIAASDPVTHWPLVFVGLLGKIFGPVGFVWAAAQGDLPWHMGWVILFNDVAWWVPFWGILAFAMREHDLRRLSLAPGSFSQRLQATPTAAGVSLWELSFQKPLLVMFVRHSGCAFCREALDDLRTLRPELETKGIQPVVVHMSAPEEGRALLGRFQLADVVAISDPERRLYRAFELHAGTWRQLFGWDVLKRGLVEGTVWKYGGGMGSGSLFQLAGNFLLDQGQIVRSHRAASMADRAPIDQLTCDLDALRSEPPGAEASESQARNMQTPWKKRPLP